MHTRLNSVLLSMLMLSPALAIAKLSPPKYCPSIQAIKSVSLTSAADGLGGWMAYNATKNQYDTAEYWTFVMFIGGANNEADAIKKANDDIAFMADFEGPSQNNAGEDRWGCVYTGLDESRVLMGVAITPAYEGLPDLAAKFVR